MPIDPGTAILTTYLASAFLSALTADSSEPEQSAADKLLEAQIKDYKRIGERRQLAINTAALISGRPASDFKGSKGDKEVFEIMQASGRFNNYDIFQGKRSKMEEFPGMRESYPKAVKTKKNLNIGIQEGIAPFHTGNEYTVSPEDVRKKEEEKR